MKYLFLFLFLASGLYAQTDVQTMGVVDSRYVTVDLDSTTTTSVYLLYKNARGGGDEFYLSTTEPDGSEKQAARLAYVGTGALSISVVTDTVTAQESDSLYATFQSYNWNKGKSAYYASANDIGYLVFDTYGTYAQAAIDYLNWTHGTMYTADLGGIIMPSTGLKITFGQKAFDTAGAATRLYVGIHLLR